MRWQSTEQYHTPTSSFRELQRNTSGLQLSCHTSVSHSILGDEHSPKPHMTDTNQFRKFHCYTWWHIPKSSLKTQEQILSTKCRRQIFDSCWELFDWRSNPDGTMYHPVIPVTEWQSWASNPLHLEDIRAGWMSNYKRNTVQSPVLLDRLEFYVFKICNNCTLHEYTFSWNIIWRHQYTSHCNKILKH
jgi:hypothetical protein